MLCAQHHLQSLQKSEKLITNLLKCNVCPFQILNTTARDIKVVKALQDLEVTEKESASFVCEVSHDEVEGKWHKDGSLIRAGDNIKMRQEGGFVLWKGTNVYRFCCHQSLTCHSSNDDGIPHLVFFNTTVGHKMNVHMSVQ